MLLLTEPGKLFALSSLDGSQKWSYFNPEEHIYKVFVEQHAGSDQILNIIVITERFEIHLNPLTGDTHTITPHGLTNVGEYRFMMVHNSIGGESVIAVPKGASKTEQRLSFTSQKVELTDQPLFYTQVDEYKISGYKISEMTGHKVWSISISSTEKIVDISTQYTTASLASESSYVLPTAFGVEGVLLYKYLDSNMFAITT